MKWVEKVVINCKHHKRVLDVKRIGLLIRRGNTDGLGRLSNEVRALGNYSAAG